MLRIREFAEKMPHKGLWVATACGAALAVAAVAGHRSQREIDKIIIHCSATRAGADFHADDIRRWHRERGFSDIGYHWVVDLDGTVEPGRDEMFVGAHCAGQNAHSIGVCYIGGLDAQGRPADTRTEAQRRSLAALVADLRRRYPRAGVYGHRDFARKDCPCFNARKEYGHE